MFRHSFKTAEGLLALCKKYKKPISEIAIRYETSKSKRPRKEIIKNMERIHEVMEEAIQKGVRSNKKSLLQIAGGDAKKIFNARRKKTNFLNGVGIRAMAYAVATGEMNACMGRIAAFPTAGGAGVVPGLTFALAEKRKFSKKKHIRGLFTASAIGMIIAERATIAAAKGGCQAEIGAAVAMAAAAVTEMRGGTPSQCVDAAAIGLKSYLGLVCDPLGGLVAVPCIKRNALGCSAAMAASDLVRAGVKSFVPFDEVIDAMNNISANMSAKFRETALGGLAITKTGNKIKRKLGMKITK